MAIKRLDSCEKLLVIPQRNKNLCVVAHRLLQHSQWALRNLVLLKLTDLSLVELRLRHVGVLAAVSSTHLIAVVVDEDSRT